MDRPIRTRRKSKGEVRPRRVLADSEQELRARLIAWRAATGRSMSALARDADITTSSVSLYFSGVMMPSYATLVAMVVKGFGVSMQRFYGPLPQQPKAAA